MMNQNKLIQAIISAGGVPYLIGGSVRDRIMGVDAQDMDVEVHGLSQDAFERVLNAHGHVNLVGKHFGVYVVDGMDVSLPRAEISTGDGHTAFSIDIDPHMGIVAASRRRDFTMNAVSYNLLTNEIVDPFGGEDDIHMRILRMVDMRTFGDDPLRVLRGMQFASRFDMIMDHMTVVACQGMRSQFASLPVERVWAEWLKWAGGACPSMGLDVLNQTHWVKDFPHLEALMGVPQDAEWHPEGDVWQHIRLCVDAAAGDPDAVFGALCHDMGKPNATVRVDGRWRSPRHAQEGAQDAREFMEDIGAPISLREKVAAVTHEHMVHVGLDRVSKRVVRRLANRLAPHASIADLAKVIQADMCGRPPLDATMPASMQEIVSIAKDLEVEKDAPQPIVMGRHLMDRGLMEPGPEMGRALAVLFEAQLDGVFDSVEGGITSFHQLYSTFGG